MATKDKTLKVEAGTMACPICEQTIPVRMSTDTGTIHYPCMWCGNPGYAQRGTKAHQIISARLTPLAAAVKEVAQTKAPAPGPAPAPTPAAPAAKKPASIWHGLGVT
jgi:hypothetical protein